MSDDQDQAGASAPARATPQVDRPSHLGFVAHEIRNPLSTALWTSELLGRLSPAERGGARGEKLAAICLRSVTRVRLLIEDHLLCERLDAGGYPVRLEPVSVTEVLATAKSRWPADGEGLSVPPDRGLMALADRSLLERALDGLLAVATGAEGTPVRVETAGRGGRIEVRVTGGPVGSLADPERGAASDQRGRVLALAMARRVAATLGGTLAADGEGYLLSIPSA